MGIYTVLCGLVVCSLFRETLNYQATSRTRYKEINKVAEGVAKALKLLQPKKLEIGRGRFTVEWEKDKQASEAEATPARQPLQEQTDSQSPSDAEHAKSSTPSSPPHLPCESSSPRSEDEQPTQSGDDNEQQSLSLHPNMAASLWEYLMVFTTGEVVLGVILAMVIGILINCSLKTGLLSLRDGITDKLLSFYQRKNSKGEKKRPFLQPPPLPTPPPTLSSAADSSHSKKEELDHPLLNEEVDDPLEGEDGWRDDRPTIHELTLITYHSTKKLRVIERAQEKWRQIGALLEVPGLTGIGTQYCGNVNDQCHEVLRVWLERGSTKYNTTWQGVLQVLMDVELNVLAKDLIIALKDKK